jgi:hypothetical protein
MSPVSVRHLRAAAPWLPQHLLDRSPIGDIDDGEADAQKVAALSKRLSAASGRCLAILATVAIIVGSQFIRF